MNEQPAGKEEAASVLLLGRKIEGKTRIGALEPTVDAAVAHRLVAPLVEIDIGLIEQGVNPSLRPADRGGLV